MFPVQVLNYWLSLGTVLLQVATVALFALYLLRGQLPAFSWAVALLRRWGLWMAFVLAGAGSALTLFYSEILGFAPCGLCWLQRVFLYPQVVLFAIAAWRRDTSIALYAIVLSVFGALVALYQHYLQMGGNALIPCPATPGADCAARFLFEFGYVTFPLMAATLFAFLIALLLFAREK